ncbi:hypothetical protein [uncultured Streptococcus sp.]|uniref:hypothetical protein n=1 Tax=Streptococcus orisratti TaxID=114652 RepID=UPI0025D525D0|nr:hypothetical protein [uncultured Streptococcus sp.]
MRNQNNLRNKKQNVLFARGKIIDVNENEPTFTVFIRNGAGRKHTYLIFRYNPDILYPIKGTNVYIEGHLNNIIDSNKFKNQHYFADNLTVVQTEISNYFNLSKSNGFAFPKHFAKFFVYGTVLNRSVNYNSIWIEVTVKDENENVVKIQYSKKMRVNDINLSVGDKVYIYALPISTEKDIEGKIVNFETLIAEDIVIENE